MSPAPKSPGFMSSQQPCASWANPLCLPKAGINCLGAFCGFAWHVRCMMHDALSSAGLWAAACRRRLVGGGLSSAGFSSAGLSSASLSAAGLSSAGLSSEACRQQTCISWLVVSSLDIGRLEDDRLAIGGLVPGRLVGLVPGRLVVGRLVISGLVLGLTSAGWARSSSSSE